MSTTSDLRRAFEKVLLGLLKTGADAAGNMRGSVRAGVLTNFTFEFSRGRTDIAGASGKSTIGKVIF